MDPIKAFEIINNIVAAANMNRQQHQLATQALMTLQPVTEDQADVKKEIQDERAE